jgi:hypothetical protein
MIQYGVVRGLRSLLLIAAWTLPATAAPLDGLVAVYWEPPGHPPAGERTRGAFAETMKQLGAPLVDATEQPAAPQSLQPMLDAAIADYAGFRFTDAIAKLDTLARMADARGGGDLDARRLAEVYLYRALSRLELGPAEAAWDDLVRAARLDPTRAIDPARFPPRVVSAYKRAVAEVSTLPRAELEVAAPAEAQVRVDGRSLEGTATVTVGQHLIAVEAPGYERWTSVIAISGAHERIQPPLRPVAPPDGDRLMALVRERAPRRVALGALVRRSDGWAFLVRELSDGKTVSDSAALGDAPARAVIEPLVHRTVGVPDVAAAQKKTPLYRRWWLWTAVGGVAAALAVVIPVSVVYGGSSGGNVVFTGLR